MKSLFFILLLLVAIGPLTGQPASSPKREKQVMDFGWRFAFGHPFDPQKDFGNGTGYFSYLTKAGYCDGAAAANFDDRAWRKLDLPHDWAVEQPFSEKASFSHGFKAIGRAFPEASVGWYRKTFSISQSDLGRKISVVFDGVFRNSIVWVNGHYLRNEQSGYSPFEYDITDILNYGGNNVIAVRVDATMEEGWFYEGAGIYRHVWLNKTSPVHVATNGTFVTSQVQGANAAVTAKAEIVNEDKAVQLVEVVQTIMDAAGKTIATEKISNIRLNALEKKEVSVNLPVSNANLWNLESPYLYKVVTTVTTGGTETH